MKYYFDCDCEKDHWQEFDKPQKAVVHFLLMKCDNKIVYDDNFNTVIKHEVSGDIS